MLFLAYGRHLVRICFIEISLDNIMQFVALADVFEKFVPLIWRLTEREISLSIIDGSMRREFNLWAHFGLKRPIAFPCILLSVVTQFTTILIGADGLFWPAIESFGARTK